MRNDRRNAALRAALVAGAILMGCAKSPSPTAAASTAAIPATEGARQRVVFPDGTAVQVEVAADDPTREQGLMFRDRLPEDRGMIFLFAQPGLYPFWMKNTLIPLDMIWIGSDRKVVHVESGVPPCKADPCPSYGPGQTEALYVLETAPGVAARHKLAPGSPLTFEGLDHVIVR